MIPTINFCPVCRGPVAQNRERNVDRLADRLRLARITRLGGEAGFLTAITWEQLQDSEKDRWRDDALTAIAALDVAT